MTVYLWEHKVLIERANRHWTCKAARDALRKGEVNPRISLAAFASTSKRQPNKVV